MTLKSRRNTQNCRNSLPNPRDSMQNPYLSKIFQPFAKNKHPREVTSLYSTNRQVKHPFAQETKDSELTK
jgi:hypothetical protein